MRYTNWFLSVRRTLAVAAAGALTLTLFPGMASADLHEDVCSDQTADQFPDDDGQFWEDEINCIAGYGIVDGFTDGEYKPGRNVTRAEMAKYMAATYETATDSTIEPSEDYFTDDDGHPLEDWINKAAEIGVVEGTGGGLYVPNRDVPRSEMAAYVSRMIEAVNGGEDIDEGSTDAFTDDEASAFEEEINELASIGVVKGTAPDTSTYEPTLLVFRGEMAGFTARAAGYLDDLGLWAPTVPPEPAPEPTIVNAELATDVLLFGAADASDTWELEFSESMATDVFEESTATDVVFDLEDPDGDAIQVVCNDGGPTPDDGVTSADCTLGDGDDATDSNDHLVITLLEDAEDRNAAGDGLVEYPLTITATANLEDVDGNEVDLAASADVVVDDESA